MTVEELSKIQAAMPTSELLERAREYIRNVSAKGERQWRMTIPVNEYDADMIFGEVCRRLKCAEEENTRLRAAVVEMEEMLPVLERINEWSPNAWEVVTKDTGPFTLNAYRETLAKALAKGETP